MEDLAQEAYHAYCEAVGWKSPITDDELPHYDDLPQEIKVVWDAVVQRLARIIG